MRVGVIGAGYFGQFHLDAWTRIEGVELAAILTPPGGGDVEAAERWGIEHVCRSVTELLEQVGPEIVDITAPSAAHFELVDQISRFDNLPFVICQKPFCRNLAEARKAAALMPQGRLFIHENFRFQPWYRQIRQLIQQGLIGEPWQATFHLRPGDGQGPQAYLERQPYFQKMERFLVHETAIHWIDTFRYLMGEVTAVSADLRRLNPAIAGEDAGMIQFAFASGARSVFDGNRLSDHAATNRRLTMGEMQIEGPDGTLRLDGYGQIHHRAHGSDGWSAIAYDWQDRNFGGDCVYLTNRAIVQDLRAGKMPETEANAYLRNLEIVEAVYRSNTERRWIDV